jgi:hypothetical protein
MIELQASTTAILQQREGVEVELKAVINGIDYQLMSIDSIGSEASTAFNALTWDVSQKSLQVLVSFNNAIIKKT